MNLWISLLICVDQRLKQSKKVEKNENIMHIVKFVILLHALLVYKGTTNYQKPQECHQSRKPPENWRITGQLIYKSRCSAALLRYFSGSGAQIWMRPKKIVLTFTSSAFTNLTLDVLTSAR